MPEAFHARLLFLAASPLVSSAKDDSACGRRSSSSDARKKLWYPGYETLSYLRDLEYRLRQKANVNLYHVSKFSLYFSTPKLEALRKFCSIIIVLDCFFCLFSILRNSELESDVVRLRKSESKRHKISLLSLQTKPRRRDMLTKNTDFPITHLTERFSSYFHYIKPHTTHNLLICSDGEIIKIIIKALFLLEISISIYTTLVLTRCPVNKIYNNLILKR